MRKMSFALIAVTFIAAFSWGVTLASIWVPVDARALPVIRVTAATSAMALMLLCSLGWLRRRGMKYLMDAMLTQHARSQARERRTATVPFRVVR